MISDITTAGKYLEYELMTQSMNLGLANYANGETFSPHPQGVNPLLQLHRTMKKLILFTTIAVLTLEMVSCNNKVEPTVANEVEMNYFVSFDTIGKYIEVELEYSSSQHPKDILLKMPVWAPGYYMIQDYPKHLCDFTVADID